MARHDRRNKVVHLRLTEDELNALNAVCAEKRISVSDALRRGGRLAGGFGPTFDGQIRDMLLEQTRQLRMIGVNINQIARAMNAGLVPPNVQLKAAFDPLVLALTEIREAYLSWCGVAGAVALSEVDADVR